MRCLSCAEVLRQGFLGVYGASNVGGVHCRQKNIWLHFVYQGSVGLDISVQVRKFVIACETDWFARGFVDLFVWMHASFVLLNGPLLVTGGSQGQSCVLSLQFHQSNVQIHRLCPCCGRENQEVQWLRKICRCKLVIRYQDLCYLSKFGGFWQEHKLEYGMYHTYFHWFEFSFVPLWFLAHCSSFNYLNK